MNLSAIALGGLEQAAATFQRAAVQVAAGSCAPAGTGPDLVHLSAAAVSMIAARGDFAATVTVLRIADQMERHAIDLLA